MSNGCDLSVYVWALTFREASQRAGEYFPSLDNFDLLRVVDLNSNIVEDTNDGMQVWIIGRRGPVEYTDDTRARLENWYLTL